MKNRNPIVVFLLGMVTGGIYSWYWAVKTKGEMNKLGEKIPTAWLWLIPVIGTVWWFWKYSEGVEHVTQTRTSSMIAFLVMFFLGNIGQAIIQDSFNKNVSATASATPAMQPEMSSQPGVSANSTPEYQAPVEQTYSPAPTQESAPVEQTFSTPTIQEETPTTDQTVAPVSSEPTESEEAPKF